mgnify:CR=1 FL=1
MKHRTHKLAAKAVAAILCAALMLTACGGKETTSNETASTETTSATATEATSVESTEMTTTEAAVEPTEAPTETPAESPAPAVEPTAASVEPTTVSTGYTYSELNQTMYAKSAVNVRDLPSTDGKKIGSLKASQEITVTGKCDQTGWYRFELNNTTGYVSDKYIVSEKPAVNTVAATGNNSTTGNQYASNTGTDEFGISDAVIENFMKTHGDGGTGNTGNTVVGNTITGNLSAENDYFDRAAAEQVFASLNAERTAAGIPALIWSEDLYNIAVQRCYENDVHAGVRAGTGENQTVGSGCDAATIHQKWHDSEGHHNNYMNSTWTYGAVAVRVLSNTLGGMQLEPYHIAYEVFSVGDSTNANSSVTINTPVQDDSVAAAPKTADDGTSTSSSNVGWSMTPSTQEDGLKKWQEQNPDVEVSFGN